MQYQVVFVLLAVLLSIVTGQNKKAENEACTSNEVCKNGFECQENVCRCPQGKKLSSETSTQANCVPVLGFRCEGHDDCEAMKGAECSDAKCYCPVGVAADAKECILKLANKEDKCTEHAQCIHLIGEYAQCRDDRCSCKLRYYYDEENNKCEKAKGLSERCQINEECFLNHEYALACKDNTCQCAEGFKLVHDSCETVDQNCETNEDCTKHNLVRCVEGICKCEKGKFIKAWTSAPDNSHTAECQLVLNSDCTSDANCIDLQGSVCESNKCICKESYFPDVADRQCVTASKPHGPCQIVQECTPVMGQLAECRDNICLCKSNYYIGQDNKCAKVKAVEATCQFNDECLQEVDGRNVLICEQSKCMCREGYVQKENECVSGANYNAVLTSTTILLMLCGILLA